MAACGKCKPGPGRFEGEGALTVMAYESAMLGLADESFDGLEWFRAPLGFDADQECIAAAKAEGFCEECITAANAEALELGGYMVHQDGQGFIYGSAFSSRDEYEAALAEQLENYALKGEDE